MGPSSARFERTQQARQRLYTRSQSIAMEIPSSLCSAALAPSTLVWSISSESQRTKLLKCKNTGVECAGSTAIQLCERRFRDGRRSRHEVRAAERLGPSQGASFPFRDFNGCIEAAPDPGDRPARPLSRAFALTSRLFLYPPKRPVATQDGNRSLQ